MNKSIEGSDIKKNYRAKFKFGICVIIISDTFSVLSKQKWNFDALSLLSPCAISLLDPTAKITIQSHTEIKTFVTEYSWWEKAIFNFKITFCVTTLLIHRCVYMLMGHISVESMAGGAWPRRYVPKAYRSNDIMYIHFCLD